MPVKGIKKIILCLGLGLIGSGQILAATPTDTPTATASTTPTLTPTNTLTATPTYTASPTATQTLVCEYQDILGYNNLPWDMTPGEAGDYVVLIRVEVLTSGLLSGFYLSVDQIFGGTQAKMAIYDDASGVPGNLLYQTQAEEINSVGVYHFFQIEPLPLNAGIYYIGFLTDSNIRTGGMSSIATVTFMQGQSFALGFPAVFGGGEWIQTFQPQMWAAFCGTQPKPTASPTVTFTTTLTPAPVYSLPFFDDFSTDKGWNYGSSWERGLAQVSVGHETGNPDPGFDVSGEGYIAGVNIGGNTTRLVHPMYYLTSPPIDASSASQLFLSFWRWLNSDEPPWMTSLVEVYDGVAWQTLWSNTGMVTDSAWTEHIYDVSIWANSQFRIRFGYDVQTASGFEAYLMSGWNLDSISVFAPTATVTPTFSATATYEITDTYTPTNTPTLTTSLTPTYSATLSSTLTSTPTFTPTLTLTTTFTPTLTVSATPTLTITLPASFTPTDTPTAEPEINLLAKAEIITALAVPNPQAGIAGLNFYVKLAGSNLKLKVRIYTASLRLAFESEIPQTLSAGTYLLNLEPNAELANGVYFARWQAEDLDNNTDSFLTKFFVAR
jgi:hypothetical protein